MSDVDLIINVHTNGIKDITNLSAATRALALNLRGITVPMTKLDAHSRAVSKALGMTNRSMNDHAKSVKQMVANQKALGAETKRVQSNIKSYAMAIQSAGGTHTVFGRELIQSRNELKAFSSTLRGLRIRAFGSDLASISLKLQRIGKDAQFVGRSLMINLTAPILLFARMGFQSLLKVDEQLVRLTKVLEGVAMSTEQANLKLKDYSGPDKQARIKQMTDSFIRLNAAITESSTKFGVAKDLVAGLAVDFAELGITANENIIALTNLTLAAEKLGSMDASGAQDLASALYFNATRAYEVAGAFDNVASAADRESKAIASATVQLNMFNTIENVTALSLKDLADSLPELGGMALSFGLSMTEAAALLAPMKAAGFDIGASANSIKVSLQRAIVPTKQNVELLARLSKQYGATGKAGNAFSESTKTGLTGLQAIVDIFGKVVEGGRNTEAGLKLMSDLFEKRQGPRMYIAIEQLNQFDAALKNVNRNRSPERLLASVAEGALVSFNKLNGTTLPETITQFSDIGVIARIAASEVGALVDGFTGKGAGGSITQKEKEGAIAARKAVADLIKQKKLNEDVDLISEVKTQTGRAMLVELAGASSAQDVANMELEQSLNSLSTATQRIKIAFKNFAADIIRYTTPALKKFSDFITNFYRKWQSLSETTRERISKLILAFIGFLAALAPIILALGTMQASVGVLGRGITFFLPKLKGMELGLAGVAGGAKKATAQLTNMYNSFVGKKQLSSIVPSFLPASGSAPLEGMIGMPKRSGTNIRLPGNVAPTPDSLFDADGNPLTGRARAAVITKNRTARLSHAARGRGAVDQYLRNEASMLSANDMRLNARGRVIGAKGSFVGRDILGEISKASVLREAALTDAGISRTGAGGARLATKRGLVDISESRALRIARGGIGGQIARRTAALPEAMSSFTSATGVTGRGFLRGMLPGNGKLVSNVGAANVRGIASAAFNAGPVAAYTKSVQGAKAAVQAMRIEQMALGGGAGRIRTMTTAMGGFMKATKLGTVALKLMKIALISTGIGAIMLGIGVAVYIIVKNFDKFKDKASGAILRVKNAWGIFKSAIESLIKPFVDLFSMFDSGSKKGGSAVGGLSKAFDVVAKVIQKVAQWFKMLVENFIQPYLYMIIDIVMFVVSIFKGNWGDAFNFLVAAVSGAVKLVIKLIAALLKGMVWITAGGIKLIIGYFTLIPKAVAKVFSFLERIPGVGGIFGWIGDSINFVIDGLYGLVDAGKNAASGAIDAVADAAIGLLDQGVKRGVSGAAGEISDDTKVPAAAEKAGEEAGEIMGNSFGNGFEDSDASGKIAKSISEGLNDAIQQLQDYVAGELGNALSKFVDESVKALEKQKASALKVFDVQIKTLGKLEKAEESLTKKKEYETNRRKIIDNQALSNEQFRRNYALAVYEGRIDDARMLQLQQSADEKGFSQDLLTIEQERARDLAKENLDALKEAINEAKDAASLFFEESITKFQESAALITKIAPVTVEQYTEQLNQLQQLTETNATNMNTTFGSMFEAFATTIADKMPNKVVGPFATNLDELVLTAKEKFGLGSDKSENTVIGITLGMLSEVGATFGDGRQSVIDSFGTITTGIATNFSEMKTKFLEEVKSDFIKNFKAALDAAEPTKVFNQAIIDGNLSILRSFQNMVDLNPALMEKLKKSLDPAIEGYIKLKAAADAAKDAAGAAADAAADAGSTGGTPGTSSSSSLTGTYAGTSRLDAFVKNNELRAARSLRALTYQEFIGNYKGFKKGGIIPSRAQNQNQGYPEGFIPAPTQEGVPTLLHGGEYILNAKAVQRIGIGALNKMNNNLIPKFIKGGVVPGGKKGTASNTRGTADRVEQQIKKAADEPFNWKKEKGLNFVEKAIFKASDFAMSTGKFAANTANAVGQTGVVGAMSLYNAAAGLIETAIPSKSQNPLKNIAARQNDLLYGTGASIPFVPRKYGQLTTVSKPYSVTMNELKAYERMSGESIPGWKKTAYALAGDRAVMDAIGIGTMGGGSFINSAVKTGIARAATSKLGASVLTATLGEGGAAALSGTLTSAANKAGTQRLSTVLSNKNLLGRIQSSYATMTGGSKTPVAPELIGFNRLYDPTGAIKQTFGKAPSTLIADVLNGRMVLPKGGFTPKFGSIGTGSFIDTTMASGSAGSSFQDGIKRFIANYRTANSLLSMPTDSAGAALNASVFNSAGGRFASGLNRAGGGIGEIFGRTISRLESSDVIPDAILRSNYGTYGDIGEYLKYVMDSNNFQPSIQRLILEELIGATDFAQSVAQGFRTPTNTISYGVFPDQRSLGNLGANLDGTGLSNTQLAAREYILKNIDLTQEPYLLEHILKMMNDDLSAAMYIPYVDSIQEFAYKMDNLGLGNVNPKTYNKMSASLYLQARQAEAGVSLGQLGWNTPENFKIFDEVYEQYIESYMQTARAIKNAGTSMTGDEFPLEGINFEEFSQTFKGSLLGIAEMNPNDLIVESLRGGRIAEAKDQLVRRIFNSLDQKFSKPGNNITPYAIDNGLSEVGRYQIRRTINPALEPGWFFRLKDNASLLTETGDPIDIGAVLSSTVSSLPSGQGLSIYSRDAASVLGRRNAGIFTAPFTTSGSITSSASNAFIQTDFGDAIRLIQDVRTQYYPAGMTVDSTPLSEMLAQMVSTKSRPLNSGAGWQLQPQDWTWQDEINLLKMSENLFGAASSTSSKFGRGIPMPKEFSDYVKQIWQANAGYFSNAPAINDQAIARIWEDFASTRNQLFSPATDSDPMEFKSFMRDPLSGYYYSGIAQRGAQFDLTDLDRVISSGYSGNLGIEFSRFNWIDPTSNAPIISPVDASGEKFHGALYQLAGRIIPEIQTQALDLFTLDDMKNSIVQNLTPQRLLESQDFARYLKLPLDNFTTETDEVLATVLNNMRGLKGYKTGSLFAAETPLQPAEFDWWLNLLKEAENYNLNFLATLPEASGPELTMRYAGLPYGQVGEDGPFTFNPTKLMSSKSLKLYGSSKTNTADWLTGMTYGIVNNRITRSRIQQSFFDKLVKWYEAPDGTNPISPAEHYYDYFASLTMFPGEDKSQFVELVELVKKVNSMSPISGLINTGRYKASLPYMQNLNAARNIQAARFLTSDTAVQYSDDVSHFAQELAAKYSSYAPLFARGGNTFDPLDDISVGSPKTVGNVADLISRGNLQSPSAILEEFVMAQIKGERLSTGMTDIASDKSLLNVNKFINKYGKMKIKGFKTGGYVPGSPSTAIPAILHGGEYVINADAVRNMGVRTMQSINQSKFRAPSGAPMYAGGGQTTNVSTVNINVDTFIGEEEWFKGMMRDYNINVLPKQQKASGLESRTFTSYNGIQGF